MNLPDVTLMFQMLHFMVAYAILRKFVFAPALMLLEHDEQQKNQLQKNVETARAEQKDLVEQQGQRWKAMQQKLTSMVPQLNAHRDVNAVRLSAPIEISDIKLSEKQKQNIQKMLHDKLSDVDL